MVPWLAYDGLCYNATRAEELLDRLSIDRIHFDEAWWGGFTRLAGRQAPLPRPACLPAFLPHALPACLPGGGGGRFAYARFNSLYADRYAMRGDPKSHDPATRPTVFATQSTHKLLAGTHRRWQAAGCS